MLSTHGGSALRPASARAESFASCKASSFMVISVSVAIVAMVFLGFSLRVPPCRGRSGLLQEVGLEVFTKWKHL